MPQGIVQSEDTSWEIPYYGSTTTFQVRAAGLNWTLSSPDLDYARVGIHSADGSIAWGTNLAANGNADVTVEFLPCWDGSWSDSQRSIPLTLYGTTEGGCGTWWYFEKTMRISFFQQNEEDAGPEEGGDEG